MRRFLSYTCPAPKRGSWARKDRAKPQPPDGETPWQFAAASAAAASGGSDAGTGAC